MPSRNLELPEGTDHIINDAMETSSSKRHRSSTKKAGATFIGSAKYDDMGETSRNKGHGKMGNDLKVQLKDAASGLQSQASEKVRTYAETGKERATTMLDDLSHVMSDAATSVDERLGAEYGEYARRAADAIANFADTLRSKDVDELYEDGRDLVRKSPGVAIGVAAVVGFTLIRLLKAGMDNDAKLISNKGD